MKRSIHSCAAILLGTVAALLTNIACSSKPKEAVSSPKSIDAIARPAALNPVAFSDSQATTAAVSTRNVSQVKAPASKPVTYRSHDYGVSFAYPWQYKFSSAKSIANGDSSLPPKPDGFEGQFTLARVDIPKGFYPDTNFDSGYFALSLNPDLSQQECNSVLNDAKLSETINGIEFRWLEVSTGGRGEATKARNYVAFANDTCYEVELAVKTKNDQGLAREVEPDHVMQRLEAILKSVTILPDGRSPAGTQLESSKTTQATVAVK
jgi:hypothetical protein